MNIKAIIKNPFKVFYHFNYTKISHLLSDKALIKLLFRARLGYKMDFNNPESFNQKIQWLKINNRDPVCSTLVDKYEVRKYIADRIGAEYLIPLYGVWDSFDEIDFSKLPDQFVIKCTHDSGSVIVCRDKSWFDIEDARKKMNAALSENFYLRGREWPYKNVKPRIIIEKYMENTDQTKSDNIVEGLIDYKFYCFSGEVKYLYVSKGLENHATARISFLNPDWTRADFYRADFKPFEELPEKPTHYNKMIEVSELLSKDFPFLRVDLYEINNHVYFSELTFSPCNGFMPFVPKEKDFEVGRLMQLPNK